MTKHIILWKLREDLTAEEKQKVKAEAKQALEGLLGKIEGLSAVTVNIESLPSSNVDMMLDLYNARGAARLLCSSRACCGSEHICSSVHRRSQLLRLRDINAVCGDLTPIFAKFYRR